MSAWQNIQKILVFASWRHATKQAGGLGSPGPSGKFASNHAEPVNFCHSFQTFKFD